VLFTTIEPVRFKWVDNEEGKVGPVVIWIGIFPESGLSATDARNLSMVLLALLKDFGLTDIEIEFRDSNYIREVGPRLLPPVNDLDPLVDVISPLTPALGLRISTMARPKSQGTMALYLAEGGDSERLLGLTCRHVLIGSAEANVDYASHPSGPRKNVIVLGTRAFDNVLDSIKLKIGRHGILAKRYREQIAEFQASEGGSNTDDVEKARAYQIETERLLEKVEKAVLELGRLLDRVKKEWKELDKRVIGTIVHSPAIRLGVGEQRFTEDWGLFVVDKSKLGDGFKGNVLDLGAF